MTADRVLTTSRLIPSTRFTLALLVSFALFVQYAQRISLSMGIVCLVDRTALLNSTPSTLTKYGSNVLREKRFVWTELQQQILLGAHSLGYLLTLAPGGWLSIKLGAKRSFALSLLLSSTATLAMSLIYFLDDVGLYLAIVLRVITGIGHGPLFPATYTLWSMWAVPLERSTLTSIGFCSTNLGTSVTMLLGGLLCRYVTSGWFYIFIMAGLLGFIWLPLWLWLAADSPLVHPTISEQERQYICDRIGISRDIDDQKKKRVVSFSSLPWKKIVHSKAIIGLVLSQLFNVFGLFFFYANVGKILTEIHRVPTQYAGYILAGGFILMPISSLSSGIIADRLVRAKKLSLTNVRKLFNSLASFIPCTCMVVLCFCDQSRQTLGVLMVVLFLFGSAIAYGSGYVVNFGDVTPAYSSIIFGIAGTIGVIGSLCSNIIAGLVIKQPILHDWRKMFIVFAISYLIGGLVFLIYGSAVPRKWATFQSQTVPRKEIDADAEAIAMLQLQNSTVAQTAGTDLTPSVDRAK